MKTIIINGSPRGNGDTASLLAILQKELPGRIMIVDAYRADIAPCVDCRYCWKNAGCCVDDDMQDVYPFLEDCDNIILASPIYFSELTGKLLDVASRLQTYFSARFMRKVEPISKKKKGGIILVGGGNGAMDKAEDTARELLKVMGADRIAPLVSSHDTDHLPAAEDKKTLQQLKELAEFLKVQEA